MITYGPIEQWPGQLTRNRRSAPFRTQYTAIMRKLEYEIRKAGARSAVVQLALKREDFRTRDGMPRANANAAHPGVIVAFEKPVPTTGNPIPLSFPCDTFDNYLDNLYAIARALESLRMVDRYGVTKRAEQYRGWAALPPGGQPIVAASMTVEEAARLIVAEGGYGPPAALVDDPAKLAIAYKHAARKHHPDYNNSVVSQTWQRINEARDLLRKHHESLAGVA